MEPVLLALFTSPESLRRLVRHIRQLKLCGTLVFTKLEKDKRTEDSGGEDGSSDAGAGEDSEETSEPLPADWHLILFEFVMDWARRLLDLCAYLEELTVFDFHPATLRIILDATKKGSAASLRSFAWNQPGGGGPDYPSGCSSVNFLDQLASLESLKSIDIDIDIPAEHASRFSIDDRSRWELPSFPLTSLSLHSRTRESFKEGANVSNGSAVLLLQATDPNTLRELSITDVNPAELFDILTQPGYHLDCLSLHYHDIPSLELLSKVGLLSTSSFGP